MRTIIKIIDLSVYYQQTEALRPTSITIPAGTRVAIVGPNGAGKSTFIKALLNLIPAQAKQIELLGTNLANARQRIAYVPQTSEVNWDFPTTVYDVVLMGISAKRFGFQRITPAQHQQVKNALEIMDLLDLKDRQIKQLSGGQKQRVFIARAIAQQADLYFLDEPLAGVDMKSEALIMAQLQQFQADGKTSITVHHDLNTVPTYFDYVIFINKEVIAHGPVESTFTPENIQKTYQHSITLTNMVQQGV